MNNLPSLAIIQLSVKAIKRSENMMTHLRIIFSPFAVWSKVPTAEASAEKAVPTP
jgi:hypothetical protein